MIVQFPNSQFVPDAQQLLRNIQEALAEGEYLVGDFYYKRGTNPSAANRFSRAGGSISALQQSRLGPCGSWAILTREWEPVSAQSAGDAYARIVRDYPLSGYADEAKKD